jgi:hypothetical protein
MIAVAQAFNQWMSQANFMARLIKMLGGPLTDEMNDNKVIAIDLSKVLLKAMGCVSYDAGQLNYGYNDENIIPSLNKSVYYYQMKYQGNWLNFYYVSSRANIAEDLKLPPGETAKELVSQKVQSFLKDNMPYLRNWWLSKNAEQLFKPYQDEDGAIKAVENIVHVLSGALKKGNDILLLVEGFVDPQKGQLNKAALADYDPMELNSFRQDISDRAMYLRAALIIALKVDGLKETLNWDACIAQAIKNMNNTGFTRIQKSTEQVKI